MIFRYSDQAHQRRHGPRGYQDYGAFKPWLRDEFEFRCVYCLCREKWFPDGDASFSVDHFIARKAAPERACDYANLLYACCQCNGAKQDATGIPDPCQEAYSAHLDVRADGTIHGRTLQGEYLVRACRLDRPKLTEFRRAMLELSDVLCGHRSEASVELRRRFFGFPTNLPDLAALKPPEGNSRSQGREGSALARLRRGELPETY